MAQQRVSRGSTQVTVALIGVAGVLGAALVSNWDKVAGPAAAAAATPRVAEAAPVAAPVAVPTPVPSPSPSATASPEAVPVVSNAARVETMGAAEDKAYDTGAAALDQVASKAASAPALTGLWRDTDGYGYRVAQQGDRFAYIQYQNGAAVGAGGGTVAGRTLDYQFSGPAGAGLCRAIVAPSGDSIAGQCSAGGAPWSFEVTRVTGI